MIQLRDPNAEEVVRMLQCGESAGGLGSPVFGRGRRRMEQNTFATWPGEALAEDSSR